MVRASCAASCRPSRRGKSRACAEFQFSILVSESSYHAPYDHCTARFLDQAGRQEYIRQAHGSRHRGNGHMMMLEKNNLEIAAFLRGWEQANVR